MSILMELYQLILKIRRSKGYESLAPISNIKKSATLDMLINAVGDSKNYNIALLGKYGAGKSSIRAFSEAISPEQFLDSSMDYNKVKDSKIYIHNYRGYGFTETEIFEYFGGKEKFLERANNIAKRPEIEIEKLIIENEKYEKEKDDLEKKPFYELFTNDEEIGINNNLIKMLLMNGYIDESYQDYMFVFKETEEINKNDYTYISNVRQHINSKYSYPIKNVEKVVEQLNENFFGTEPILNYNVIDFLITNENEGIKEKQHYCLSMLSELDKNKENFILGFIKYAKNGVEFLTKLYNENNNVIYEILINNSDKIDKTELIIKNILNIPEILNYDKTNNFIRSYIEEKKDLSSWIELNENVEKSLKILNVKFGNLEENDTNLLKFIYNNNLYKLNSKMIMLLFKYKGLSRQEFDEKNLSIIVNNSDFTTMKEYVEKEKEEYMNNCYLETAGTKNNINDIIECLNNWNISKDSKEQIIKNMSEQIEDIRDINTDYYEKIMANNKIKPTWENYYYYYTNSNEITDTLLQNIELNIENIKKQNVSSIKMPEEDEKEFTNFIGKIARNNELNISVYKQILPACGILLNTIEENEIEAERLKILVSNKIIKINNNNLQVLYGEVPEIISVYINDNICTFINEIKNYTLTGKMVCDIIKSSNIKFKDKNRILDLIDISYINEDSMEFIINNYSQNRISKMNEELKQKIFKSQLNINCKLMFLEKEVDKNNSIDLINNYLKLLPVPYKYIADYENYPKAFSIPKTERNENILERLEEKGFNFTKSTKKNRIIIYNKK